MKTRSNMPLFVVECDNVKTLSNSQIDLLRCGDWLVKKDASGEHPYKVTFKSDTGICLTYMDASVVETQSYDKVDGNWVYNSEDKQEITDAHFQELMEHGEPMEGYSFSEKPGEVTDQETIYAGAVKNGNKLTLVLFTSFKKGASITATIGQFYLPSEIMSKLYSTEIISGYPTLDVRNIDAFDGTTSVSCLGSVYKQNVLIEMNVNTSNLIADTKYFLRYEVTFLLSDNLVSE